MTARPLRSPARTPGLRVIAGKRVRRVSMVPWLAVSLVTIAAFLALVLTRTALDRAAFELAELNAAIAEQQSVNQKLRVEIAELENPARIAPLAEELGLVIPSDREQLLVEGVGRDDGITDPDYAATVAADVPRPSS